MVIVAVLVGLRFEVGSDWFNYELIYRMAGRNTFLEAISAGDPAYQALNWLAVQFGAEMWLVNLVCAAIFSWGLFRFCAVQPLPWVAALVAVPYVVIVVAMGYTRQGVALGIIMAGLASLLTGSSVVRFAAYVFAAALFHRTAVIAFPIVALAVGRNKVVNFFVVVAFSFALYDFFLVDSLEDLVDQYIRTRYSSQGAAIRLGMSAVAAAVLFLIGRRLPFSLLERRLWRNFSFATVGFILLLIMLPSSTAVDRLSIYVMPLQIAVMARLPLAFKTKLPGTVIVGAYFAAVQFVWLNFAVHADAWLPYRMYPLA